MQQSSPDTDRRNDVPMRALAMMMDRYRGEVLWHVP